MADEQQHHVPLSHHDESERAAPADEHRREGDGGGGGGGGGDSHAVAGGVGVGAGGVGGDGGGGGGGGAGGEGARRGPPDISNLFSVKVDNLTFDTMQADLEILFSKYGKVHDVRLCARCRGVAPPEKMRAPLTPPTTLPPPPFTVTAFYPEE